MLIKKFSPCPITNEYILFARLRPKISTIIPGEELIINAKMSLHTALEDGAFTSRYMHIVSLPDKMKMDAAWQTKLANMRRRKRNT